MFIDEASSDEERNDRPLLRRVAMVILSNLLFPLQILPLPLPSIPCHLFLVC